MKFKKVELHAFRAYESKGNGTFDFSLPNDTVAGFISIYAPNGFGKTSFYDGVEWGMTNSIHRFNSRSDLAKAERGIISQTTGARQKQYILKNKFVDESINGYVSLVTVNGKDPLIRNIPQPKRGGSVDHTFDDTLVEKKYFRDVMLSQEGIDAFLKASNPKERYNKFLDYFGDEKIAKYSQKLELLIKQNSKKMHDLESKIDEVNELLNEPIDVDVFANTNKLIDELIKQGENIKSVDSNFDSRQKIELTNLVSKRLLEIEDDIKKKSELNIKLSRVLHQLDNHYKRKKELNDKNNNLKLINNILELKKKIDKINGKIEFLKTEKEKLFYRKKIYPIYEKKKNDLISLLKKVDDETKRQSVFDSELIKINLDDSKAVSNKKIVDEAYKLLSYELENAMTLFESIEVNKGIINQLNLEIQNITDKKEVFTKKLQNQQDLEDKLNRAIQDIQSNVFLEIREDEKYNLSVEKLEKLLSKRENVTHQLKKLSVETKKIEKLDKDVEGLIELGSAVINSRQIDTCPLCAHKYDSYDDLITQVIHNPVLSDIIKKLLAEKQEIETKSQDLNNQITEIQKIIHESLVEELKPISLEKKELQLEIKKLDDTLKTSLTNKKNSDDQYLKSLALADNKSKEEYINIKKKDLFEVKIKIEEVDALLAINKENIEKKQNLKSTSMSVLEQAKKEIDEIENNDIFKQFDDYNHTLVPVDILKTIEEQLSSNNKSYEESFINLNSEQLKLNELMDNQEMPFTPDTKNVEELSLKIEQLKVKINEFEDELFYIPDIIFNTQESTKEKLEEYRGNIKNSIEKHTQVIQNFKVLNSYGDELLKYVGRQKLNDELLELSRILGIKQKVYNEIDNERRKVDSKINEDVKSFFDEELINQIYTKIDPHPDYKNVRFECSFEQGEGKLNVFVDDHGVMPISPVLYYSTAQLNVLSLSIFLAKALNVKDDDGNPVDSIFIDDPVQSMDSINILSTIDLLRSIVVNHNKQIILSTHDENFHLLLQKKIPKNLFPSKFIRLETFGKVKVE